MLLSRPDKDRMEVIQQLHEMPLWQRLVKGPIAIVPLTIEGIAVIVNRNPPAKLRESIMIPLQDYKKYNLWGSYFFVKYHQGQVVDLTDSDIFTIKGLLGEPIPIQLSVDLAAALGYKPLCQFDGCGFMEEHPSHTAEGEDPVEGIRPHAFVKPESIEVETLSEAEATKLTELQQSGTSEPSPMSGAVQP